MRPIKLDEMTNRRKVQYAQSKKKLADRVIFSIYGVVVVYFVVLIACACIVPEETNELHVLALLAAATIAIVLVGYKKHHKIMDMYDAVMQERVWEGYIDDFHLEEEIEFIDKNNQTLQKTFISNEYKEFVNAGRIHVVYISRLDRWYMEKGE